jgi:hypothetical protein
MSALTANTRYGFPAGMPAALKVFVDEATALVQALANPGKLIREVEEMHALHTQARRIEASEPARAAELRRRAALLGLR